MDPGRRIGLRLRLSGSTRYADILRRAFRPPTRWYGPYESFDPGFDYVLYAQDADESCLRGFLKFASETLLVPTAALDECWAMAMHVGEDLQRTKVGELVYRAKTYPGKPGDAAVAGELAALMAERMLHHPLVLRADRILGVPANPPKVANLLRQAGAVVVIGVAATKTLRSERDSDG